MEIIEFLEQMNSFLGQSFIFRTVKALLAFYMIIIVLTLIGILFRTGKMYLTILSTGQEFQKVTRGKFQKRWDNVLTLINSDNPLNWKAAILESAQMLDETLDACMYKEETLGAKLDNMLESQIKNLDQIKEANKIKNYIVQKEDFEISKEEAQKIVDIFGEGMKFFEVIS